MPSKIPTVCLDANIIISAFGYDGIPLTIMERLFSGTFHHVTSTHILEEARRNLIHKMRLDESHVDLLIDFTKKASSLYIPSGHLKVISHPPDNLVLEVAVAGSCDVLVTGDKKHLLPLNPFQGIIIESPSNFLKRLNSLKGS